MRDDLLDRLAASQRKLRQIRGFALQFGLPHPQAMAFTLKIDAQLAKTVRTWIPYPLCQVDDALVYVAYYKDGDPPIYGSGNKFHQHDGDQLFVVLTGSVVFHDRAGGRVEAVKGDAVIVSRGEFHRASSKAGAHVLHVQSKSAAALFKEEFDRGPEVVAG